MVPYELTPELLPWMRHVQGDAYLYIATPYPKDPGGREEAFKDASKAGAWFLVRGIYVYAPIPHTYPIHVYGNVPDSAPDDERSYKNVLAWDRALASPAVGIIVVKMAGWE